MYRRRTTTVGLHHIEVATLPAVSWVVNSMCRPLCLPIKQDDNPALVSYVAPNETLIWGVWLTPSRSILDGTSPASVSSYGCGIEL